MAVKSNGNKAHRIWSSVLIIFVCVAATAAAVTSRLQGFLFNDEGTIILLNPESTEAVKGLYEAPRQASVTDTGASIGINIAQINYSSPLASTQSAVQSADPELKVSDDNTVWNTGTQIEIFRISYVNGKQTVTVASGNGEKVIAPGTKNSYTFKLMNTGDGALDYTVEIDARFSPSDTRIPITGRLSRYDGEWVVGNVNEYAKISELDSAEDRATLGAGRYTYYTLDWLWPYESGNDELDTALGDLAVDEDLTFTIVIKTTATVSSESGDDSGITPPQTGDSADRWILIAVIALAAIMLLAFSQGRRGRYHDAQENKR